MDQDIDVLRVEVVNQSDEIVRIRIVDPTTKRWEPPLPAIPVPSPRAGTKYIVDVTNQTRLRVRRRINYVPETTLYVRKLIITSVIYSHEQSVEV